MNRRGMSTAKHMEELLHFLCGFTFTSKKIKSKIPEHLNALWLRIQGFGTDYKAHKDCIFHLCSNKNLKLQAAELIM